MSSTSGLPRSDDYLQKRQRDDNAPPGATSLSGAEAPADRPRKRRSAWDSSIDPYSAGSSHATGPGAQVVNVTSIAPGSDPSLASKPSPIAADHASVATLQTEVTKLHQQLAATVSAAGVTEEQRASAVAALTAVLQQRQLALAEAQVAAAAAVAPAAIPAAASSKLAAALATVNASLLGSAAAAGANPGSVGGVQPQTRVYVGNLTYEVGEPELRALFSPFGRVNRVDASFEALTGKTKGYAFVTFDTHAAAESAIAGMHGQSIGGRTLRVAWPANTPGSAVSAGGATSTVTGSNTSGALAPDLMSAAEAAAAAAKAGGGAPSAPPAIRIFVGAVPYEMNAEHLRAIFGPFGAIRTVTLLPSLETPGSHRGYGFVEFDDEAAGLSAIEAMHGFEIGGRRLKVSQATSTHAPGGGLSMGSGSAVSSLSTVGAGGAPLNGSGSSAYGVAAPGGGMLGALGFASAMPPLPLPTTTTMQNADSGAISWEDAAAAASEIVDGGNTANSGIAEGVDFAAVAAAAAAAVLGPGFVMPTQTYSDAAAFATDAEPRHAPPQSSPTEGRIDDDLTHGVAAAPTASAVLAPSTARLATTDANVIAIGNMVSAAEAREDPSLADEVREEAEQCGGPVRSVRVHVHDDERVTVFVHFFNSASARAAVASLDKRHFGGRITHARLYDDARAAVGDWEG